MYARLRSFKEFSRLLRSSFFLVSCLHRNRLVIIAATHRPHDVRWNNGHYHCRNPRWGCMLLFALFNAYRIRTYALKEYGMVIHEFDPWFNFRATQYLAKHGWRAFFHWYDHMSWYPLG